MLSNEKLEMMYRSTITNMIDRKHVNPTTLEKLAAMRQTTCKQKSTTEMEDDPSVSIKDSIISSLQVENENLINRIETLTRIIYCIEPAGRALNHENVVFNINSVGATRPRPPSSPNMDVAPPPPPPSSMSSPAPPIIPNPRGVPTLHAPPPPKP